MSNEIHELLLLPWRHWTSGGVLLVPIALVCFGIWRSYLGLRGTLLHALKEGREIEDRLGETGARRRVEEWVDGDRAGGVFAPALARVAAAVRRGIRPAFAFAREERMAMMRLQRGVVVLAALTAVAPLLGLLGTVTGMIETFHAVSVSGAETSRRVASGISSALITTQFGLTVAIPGVFGLARVRRLVHHVQARFGRLRLEILPLLAPGTRGGRP